MSLFNELKEFYKKSWIGRYTINWILGLLLITFITFIFFIIGCFITWSIPNTIFDNDISNTDMALFRFFLVIYSSLIFFITEKMDFSDY